MRVTLALALLVAGPALAQPGPVSKPLAAIEATLSGQPIDPPAGPLRVTVTEVTIPAGGGLAAHKHPYPRVVQVLEGRLKVTNLVTGQSVEKGVGDWMVDAVEQWHEAQALDGRPARIMTIDHAPPGAAVTVMKPN
jgi:quercetin dioxygenase-like cupin family protein